MSTHLDFLRNLQRLLDEGVFTATYKYALLLSLADLAVERPPDGDGSMRLNVQDIAEKFIDYYWRQTVPYRETSGVLQQNSGRQAAVVNHVAEARAIYDGNLGVMRKDRARWSELRAKVSGVIRQMPLWKLQVVGGQTHEFLYRHSEYTQGNIRLLPDAARCFREMYVIITNFVRGAWVTRLQTFGLNRDILGDDAGLYDFLFGCDRTSLRKYRDLLKDYQQSRCFYCGKVAGSGDLDHFIPWSRYPVDLGHNFVYSHSRCNRQKSDFLAHTQHLAKWKERNLDESMPLSAALSDAGLAHDHDRSRQVAVWAYEQGEASGSYAWIAGKRVERLGADWRQVLC